MELSDLPNHKKVIRLSYFFALPKDAVNVELHEHTLTLSGERTREPAVTGGQYQREEGRYGAFQRAFRLPTIVDQGKVQATYKNGVLALRLPKRNEVRPQGIPVTG